MSRGKKLLELYSLREKWISTWGIRKNDRMLKKITTEIRILEKQNVVSIPA